MSLSKKEREELTEMKAIASEFIGMHKNADYDSWFIQNKNLEAVYYNLVGGVFGYVHSNEGGECTVEIGGYQSKSGNPELFEFKIVGEEK